MELLKNKNLKYLEKAAAYHKKTRDKEGLWIGFLIEGAIVFLYWLTVELLKYLSTGGFRLYWISHPIFLVIISLYLVYFYNDKKFFLDFSKFKLAPLLWIYCLVSFVLTLSGPDTCKKEYKSYRADIDRVVNSAISGDKWARGEGGRVSMVQSDREWKRYKKRWGCEDKY